MNIIVDSNIFFACIIKDSTVRRIIFLSEANLLFPLLLFEEFEKHIEEIVKKTNIGNSEFIELMDRILNKIMIIPNTEIYKYKDEALELVKNIDPDDSLIIACALAYPNSIIWSDDKALKKQAKIKVLNTQEIISMLDV